MCRFQTPLHCPAQAFPNSSKEPPQPSPFSAEQGTSSDENEVSGKNKTQCTSPSRRESYSDSSVSGEDDPVRTPAQAPGATLMSALTQTLSSAAPQAHNHHEAPRCREEPACTMFYLPRKIASTAELESRYGQSVSRAAGAAAMAAAVHTVVRIRGRPGFVPGEDSASAPSTHARQLMTSHNSSSSG